MKLNITPGPWEFVRPKESNGYVYVNACGDTTGSTATCYNGDFFPDNAAAIVTAVNNTYHKGINPEAVPGLLKIAVEVRNWYEENHFKYMGEDTPVCFSKLISAIQESTL